MIWDACHSSLLASSIILTTPGLTTIRICLCTNWEYNKLTSIPINAHSKNEDKMCLLIAEIIMLIGGIYALTAGKVKLIRKISLQGIVPG